MKKLFAKKSFKIVLTVLLSALIVVNTLFVVGADGGLIKNAFNSLLGLGSSETTQYKNTYERLLAEDGFIYGMDWDWFGNWSEGTTSFGNNEITGNPSVYRKEYTERSLYNMKALGYNAVSVWITNDGGGITYDQTTGYATGLNASFIKNITDFLDSCRKVGIAFVPTLLVHGYASNYNQPSLGLSVQEKYYKYFRYYYDDGAREAYIKNAIEPICEILSDYQDVVAMVDLTVENGTGAVNDPDNGMMYTGYFGTTWENFCKLNNALHDASKKYMPDVPTSVEDVGWDNNSAKYNDLKVDIIGRNEYSSNGAVGDLTSRFITRPAYLGEYNLSEDSSTITEEKQKQTLIKFLGNAINGGYIGAFYYNWNNEAGGARCFFKGENCDDYETMRSFVPDLCYNITDLKNDFHGITNYNYKPILLYNNGSKDLYWIGGKNVDHFILERKANGGEWTVVNNDIDFNENLLDNGLIRYTDNTMVEDTTYQYRVTAVLNDGATIVSDVGNSFEMFIPVELFKDSGGNYSGSFEEGELVGNEDNYPSDGWYDAAWNSPIGEFSKAEARTGEYSLHVDYSQDIGTNSNYGAKWAYNIQLQPNTMYNISYWYKNSAGSISLVVKQPVNDTQLGYGTMGKTEDNEWHKGSFKVTAPSDGKIRVFIQSLKNDDTKFYLDDFSITEAR